MRIARFKIEQAEFHPVQTGLRLAVLVNDGYLYVRCDDNSDESRLLYDSFKVTNYEFNEMCPGSHILGQIGHVIQSDQWREFCIDAIKYIDPWRYLKYKYTQMPSKTKNSGSLIIEYLGKSNCLSLKKWIDNNANSMPDHWKVWLQYIPMDNSIVLVENKEYPDFHFIEKLFVSNAEESLQEFKVNRQKGDKVSIKCIVDGCIVSIMPVI